MSLDLENWSLSCHNLVPLPGAADPHCLGKSARLLTQWGKRRLQGATCDSDLGSATCSNTNKLSHISKLPFPSVENGDTIYFSYFKLWN